MNGLEADFDTRLPLSLTFDPACWAIEVSDSW